MGFYSYNEPMYNEHQYNADTNDVLLEVMDSVTSTDAIFKAISQALADAIASNESHFFANMPGSYLETVFIDDFVSKSISNKGLSDTVRLSVWLKLKLNSANKWTD